MNQEEKNPSVVTIKTTPGVVETELLANKGEEFNSAGEPRIELIALLETARRIQQDVATLQRQILKCGRAQVVDANKPALRNARIAKATTKNTPFEAHDWPGLATAVTHWMTKKAIAETVAPKMGIRPITFYTNGYYFPRIAVYLERDPVSRRYRHKAAPSP